MIAQVFDQPWPSAVTAAPAAPWVFDTRPERELVLPDVRATAEALRHAQPDLDVRAVLRG
ncbi:hypothetical protein [Amycolatopsis sp. H20-H5]|uniref:hypothetical protein n=1 Tax=Amycolatopsis sp. H20-H5 TaxID=3046309 RepID=UPI003FA38EF9